MPAALLLPLAATAAKEQPNVVIIFTDDQGWGDLNRFGGSDLVTPNMDRICDEGVRFTNFYANSSISSPSRAALLTGRYPQRAGMPDLANGTPGSHGMPASELTIAEVLREEGYATALIGKWHLGQSKETMPQNQGFDYSFGHLGGCIDNYSHFFYWSEPNVHDLWENSEEIYREGENFSRLMIEKSFEFIDKNRDNPFLLFFSSNYPHYPLQGDAKWREYYKDMPHPRNKFAAMVSTIDERIGELLDKLDSEGLRENTIIIFMSDNGYSTEPRTYYGGGSARHLRGSKFSCFEGGIRVPAAISYPKRLPSNEVRSQVAMGADWFPTIMELCGIKRDDLDIDGSSIVKLIKSPKAKSPHEVICWSVEQSWAVREGDMKLVNEVDKFTKERSFGLYNIAEDEGESCDLSAKYPEIVERLTAEYKRWRADTSKK